VISQTEQKQQPAKSGRRLWRLVEQPALICLFLAVVTVLAFWPVVHGEFINYDDTDYVTLNSHVQNGLSSKSVIWAFTTDHASNWHPLTWLSHMLDVELFGKGPTGPHCINLLFHVANSVLLFLLLGRMTGAQWRSAMVAGLFALHPAHVESVAWVAERKDVLSTLFWMLTLLAYVRYANESKVQGPRSKAFYGLAVTTFALGLMSKPMLVTLPFVMLLLDFWPLNRFENSSHGQTPRTFHRLVLEKTPFLLLSAVSCVVTAWAQKKAILSLEHLSLFDRIANSLVAYSRYLEKTIWPTNLALPYLHPGHWPEQQVAIAAILVAGLSLVALLAARKYPHIFTGWFWYLGTLIPVIGLVQVGAQSMADRYTYVPLIGVFVVLVWSAADWCGRRRLTNTAGVAVAVLVLGVCVGQTRQQVKYWHDSEPLFKHSAAVTRDNFIALGNVGGVCFESGRLDEAMEYYQQAVRINPNYAEALNSIGAVLAARGNDKAVEWFRKALTVQPAHAPALFNMGNAMAKKGDDRAAVEFFQAALQVEPGNYQDRNNLGNALVKLGRLDEATAQYRLALEYKPDAPKVHKNLGEMLAAKGKLDEAIAHYRQALALTNDAATHYSLGLTLAVQGKWDEAIEQYTATLRLSPTNAQAQYNLGYAYKVQGRSEQAMTHLREALRLIPEFPLAHYNLACVLADKNLQEEAISHLREALRLKPDYEEAQKKLSALESQQRN
jgi:tetratricopeptide (TPR) repeat protein